MVSTGPLQMLLTAASMVACINAIVGGVTVAVVGFASLFFVYQVRRFRRAAAVVSELYEDESPGMPGWTEPVGERKGSPMSTGRM
jgi:hypothetical protein